MGAPKIIIDFIDRAWRFESQITPERGLLYSLENSEISSALKPEIIEKIFSRKGRPEPQSSRLIRQGRWECGPASLAMLLNESLWDVKRAASHCGWNNDDRGISDDQIITAARLLGHEVIQINEANPETPQIVVLPSLNVKNVSHAVFWDGKEILDPNWGNASRKWWGCEWDPMMIPHQRRVFVRKSENVPLRCYSHIEGKSVIMEHSSRE